MTDRRRINRTRSMYGAVITNIELAAGVDRRVHFSDESDSANALMSPSANPDHVRVGETVDVIRNGNGRIVMLRRVELPEATKKPCNDCPWRRMAAPGWLGPYSAEEWVALAHGEEAIACHQTIENEGQWTGNIRQCAGAAIYRANVCKSPRDPAVARLEADRETVFARPAEFIEYHTRPLTSST